MRKCFSFIAILLILVPVDVLCQTTYDAKKKLLSIKSEGKLISEILLEVSAKTGVDFFISPAVDKEVFIDIESQPLEKAIKIIIKNLNNAIIFQGNSIDTVRIFEESEAKSYLNTPSGFEYLKLTSPPIMKDLDKNIQTMEEFEDATKGKRNEISETPIVQSLDINIQTMEEFEDAAKGKRKEISETPIVQDLDKNIQTMEEFEDAARGK